MTSASELDVCVVGHVTRDVVAVGGAERREQPGGLAWHASMTLAALGARVGLITRIAPRDADALLEAPRRAGVHVVALEASETTAFENVYAGEGLEQRTQRVGAWAEPFRPADLGACPAPAVRSWLLGPLLSGDTPRSFLNAVAAQRAHVALDLQGLLREVRGETVVQAAVPLDALFAGTSLHIACLKASADEASLVTGIADPVGASEQLARVADEALVTRGAEGAVVHAASRSHEIPAILPRRIVDPTGCGDAFLAAYLWRRLQGDAPDEAGRFAAGVATRKLEGEGGPGAAP